VQRKSNYAKKEDKFAVDRSPINIEHSAWSIGHRVFYPESCISKYESCLHSMLHALCFLNLVFTLCPMLFESCLYSMLSAPCFLNLVFTLCSLLHALCFYLFTDHWSFVDYRLWTMECRL